MCRFIYSDLYLECGHAAIVDTGKKSRICLLGKYCKEIGYANKVHRRRSGKCPYCAGTDAKTKGLLDSWPATKVPHYLQDKEGCIAAAVTEVKKVLSNEQLTDKGCKDVLLYILGLPGWLKKGRLVNEFGYLVQGFYGDKWEKEMVRLTKNRHFDESLVGGMKRKQGETSQKK